MIQRNVCKQDFSKLQNYCNKRKAFYHLSAQKIGELEGVASTLQSLSVRWVESKDHLLIEPDMKLFKTSIEVIKGISETVGGTSEYIKRLTESAISSVIFSSEDTLLNTLLLSFVVNTNDDQITAQSFMSIADSLRNSIRLLSHQTVNNDLQLCRHEHFGFKLLFASVAMIDESAKKARDIVDFVLSQEKERQELCNKIQFEVLEQSKKYRFPQSADFYVI
jgi:hypothetical protein